MKIDIFSKLSWPNDTFTSSSGERRCWKNYRKHHILSMCRSAPFVLCSHFLAFLSPFQLTVSARPQSFQTCAWRSNLPFPSTIPWRLRPWPCKGELVLKTSKPVGIERNRTTSRHGRPSANRRLSGFFIPGRQSCPDIGPAGQAPRLSFWKEKSFYQRRF